MLAQRPRPGARPACGDIPPAELEAAYYSQNAALTKAGQTTNRVSGLAGAVQAAEFPLLVFPS